MINRQSNTYTKNDAELITDARGTIKLDSYIFALYIVFLPIAAGLSGIIGSISLLNYISLVYLGLALVRRLKEKILIFYPRIKYVYFYFYYTLLTCLWNQHFEFDWYFTTFITTVLLFTFSTMNHYSEKELLLFKNAVLASIVVVFVVTLANIATATNYRLYITVSSTIDPNDFACGLCIMIALLMTFLLEQKRKLVAIPLVLLFLIVIISGSRGAILMVLGMIVYWLGVSMKNKKLMTLLIAILAFAIVYIVFEDHISQYLLERISIVSVINDGGSGRLNIWKAALNKFMNSNLTHMLFGYGHGGFRDAVNYVAIGHTRAYEAHNMFINALIEGGVLGLILLLLAFVQVFKYASNNRNTWGCLSIIGFFMEGLSLDAQSYRVFALAFIIAVIYKGVNENAISGKASNFSNSANL